MEDLITTLVVDDQPDVRLLIRALIEAAGGAVVVGEAPDGRAGVDLAEALHPEVVVLDWMMPGMNGIVAARRIRAASPDARIILCSAYSDRALEDEARGAGVDRCVSKDDIASLPRVIGELAAA